MTTTTNYEKRLLLAEEYESNVRLYSRLFPDVFNRAEGSVIHSEQGKSYLDFLSGAGVMNYGHNNPVLKKSIMDYIMSDGIIHSLDMHTLPHIEFLIDFQNIILKPRNLNYKIQFTGPTGANAVEAALKLARLYTKRKDIIYFDGAYHGMSLGALSVSDLKKRKDNIGIDFPHTIMFPYDHTNHSDLSIKNLRDHLSQLDKEQLPAAMILEMIQGEGGINVPSNQWLHALRKIASEFGILLIADEIQTGCGRSGHFFGFEESKLHPDIVCLSKSLSGYGLPLSIILFKPELDVWESGEHTGTFRGNNLALVSAIKALDFWKDDAFQMQISEKAALLEDCLQQLRAHCPEYNLTIKGRGLMRGIEWSEDKIARSVSKTSFKDGVIIEATGKRDQVLKIMPPLTISKEHIMQGMSIIERSIKEVTAKNNEH